MPSVVDPSNLAMNAFGVIICCVGCLAVAVFLIDLFGRAAQASGKEPRTRRSI